MRRRAKRGDLVLGSLALLALLAALLLAAPSARALPEYAAQTGEPCATCHVSPSGGGIRTPRGQAWVGSGRPGAVPALADALAALGVRVQADQSAYLAPAGSGPGAVPAAGPLDVQHGQVRALQAWLDNYQGN